MAKQFFPVQSSAHFVLQIFIPYSTHSTASMLVVIYIDYQPRLSPRPSLFISLAFITARNPPPIVPTVLHSLWPSPIASLLLVKQEVGIDLRSSCPRCVSRRAAMVVVNWADATNAAKSDISITYLTSASNEMATPSGHCGSSTSIREGTRTRVERIEAYGREAHQRRGKRAWL